MLQGKMSPRLQQQGKEASGSSHAASTSSLISFFSRRFGGNQGRSQLEPSFNYFLIIMRLTQRAFVYLATHIWILAEPYVREMMSPLG